MRPEGWGAALMSGSESWADPPRLRAPGAVLCLSSCTSTALSVRRGRHSVLIQATGACESGNPNQKLPRCGRASRAAATLASLAQVSGSTAEEGQRGREGAHRHYVANEGEACLTIRSCWALLLLRGFSFLTTTSVGFPIGLTDAAATVRITGRCVLCLKEKFVSGAHSSICNVSVAL